MKHLSEHDCIPRMKYEFESYNKDELYLLWVLFKYNILKKDDVVFALKQQKLPGHI